MKKLFSLLFIFTVACILAACNSLPTPQVNAPDKQQETKNNESKGNEGSNEDGENTEETNDESNKDNEQEDNSSSQDNDELAADFQAYVDEIMLLAPEEIRIIEAYGSVSGDNYVNDSIMYDALYYDVVPSYTEFVRALEGIEPSNEIIQDLHAIYVEAATVQLGAFTVMISALEEQSTDLVQLANQGLSEASTLISEWQAQVQVLSVQTGVSF